MMRTYRPDGYDMPWLQIRRSRWDRLGRRITAALIAVALLVGATGFALSQTLTSTSDVRIVAQKLEDGRIEFGLEQDGERILPRTRFFPASAQVGKWLKSSAVSVDVVSDEQSVAAQSSSVLDAPRVEWPTEDMIALAQASSDPFGVGTFTKIDGWSVFVQIGKGSEFSFLSHACTGDGTIFVSFSGTSWFKKGRCAADSSDFRGQQA